MAKVQGQAQIDMILNGKNAEDEIKNLTEEFNHLKRARETALDAGDLKSWKRADAEMIKVSKTMRAYEKKTIDVEKVMRNLSGTTKNELTQALRVLQARLSRMKETDPGYAKMAAQARTLDTRIKKVNTSLRGQQSLWQRASAWGNKYTSMIVGATASLTGLIMAGRKAAEFANDREEKKDYLGALTGLDDESIDKLEQNAIKASSTLTASGVRIKQSADDIIDAYTVVGSQRPELLKDADALTQTTLAAITLAEASKMELEPAAQALTNTLNQHNLAASESERVINAYAAASQAGAGNIPYLDKAVEKSGTTFSLMNQTVEQNLAAIEAIAPNYSRAELAGNSLDKVMLKMKANQIGYTSGVFDLNDAIDELREMYASGTSSVDIFGVEHAKMGELLVRNQEAYNGFLTAVTGTDKALEQAAKNTSNNAAALAQAKNRAHEYAVVLGQELAPVMTKFVSAGTMAMRMLSVTIDFVKKHKKELLLLTVAITAYATARKVATKWDIIALKTRGAITFATKAYGLVVQLLTGKITLATAATRAFNAASKANIIGAIAAILVVAVTAFITYRKKLGEATVQQKAFNEELKRSEELMETSKKLEERGKMMATMSKRQLETYVNDLKSQKEAEEDFHQQILTSLKTRIDEDTRINKWSEELKAKDTTAIRAAFLRNLIQSRKKEIASEIVEESKANKLRLTAMSTHLDKAKALMVSKFPKEAPDTSKDKVDLEMWLEKQSVQLLEFYAKRKIDKESYDSGMLILDLEYWKKKNAQDTTNEAESIANRKGYYTALTKVMEANQKAMLKPIKDDTSTDDELKKKAEDAMDAHMKKHTQFVAQMEVTPTSNIWQKLKANAEDYFNSVADLSATAQNALDGYTEMQTAQITEKYRQETEEADNAYAAGLMSKERYEQKQTEIARKQAEEEKKLKKKTADVQFALTMGQIISQAALAVMGTWAGYAKFGPFGTGMAIAQTVAIGALTAVQTAQAVSQRKIAKGLESGGYTDVTRAQDGKQYRAKNAGGKRGYIDETSILAAEASPEFMVNGDGVKNPTIKPVLDIINLAQKNGTARTINLPEEMSARGMQDGGYTKPSSASVTSNQAVAATPQQPILVEARFPLFRDSGASNIDNFDDMMAKWISIKSNQ